MKKKLLPCPFCGSEPKKVYKSNGQTTHIECPNCRAQFPKSTMANRYDDAWNTRAERTCHVTFKRGAIYDVANYSCCGYEFAESISEQGVAENYCPNCGARVVD